MLRCSIPLVILACSSKSPSPVAPPPGPTTATKPPPPDAARSIDAAVPVDAPAIPIDAACPAKPLPKGCPATAPNVDHPCAPKGIECLYAEGCCPSPLYVCNKKGRFEAHFTRCN